MNAFENHRIVSRRRRAALFAGAGLLALSGLGFAAAYELGWTKVFLRTEVNGEIIELELTPDENGQVFVTLQTEDGPGEFSIQVPQCEGDEALLIDATQQYSWIPDDEAASGPR